MEIYETMAQITIRLCVHGVEQQVNIAQGDDGQG
jgi:hypothetical protein